MQDWPLTVDRMVDHAARWHGAREIVSRADDGSVVRIDYATLRSDAARLSNALLAYGVVKGDRVATLAMNGARHLAAWYAIAGIGAVCHTLNPRYPDDQLRYILRHAGDRLIFVDGAFLPIVARIWPDCPALEAVVSLSPAAEDSSLAGTVHQLASFVEGHSDAVAWGGFDEGTAAGLCYTSGTTGAPKGVLYSHRSNFLHTLATIAPDMFALSQRDTILPVVPMYHANAWGMTFSAPAVGAKLVLPGRQVDGASLCELMAGERVTVAAGVPTVWLAVLDHLRGSGLRLPDLERVIVGGAPLPERVMRDFEALGVEVIHAWGMTEMSPTGTVCSPTARTMSLGEVAGARIRLKQGRVPCGVDMKIVGEDGAEVLRDGRAVGRLKVRGFAVASGYYGHAGDALDCEGFFDTGDIASIDGDGFMRITDRAKDVIKSGGEWISSLEIEDAAASHPMVGLAGALGVPHPKWGERPVLFVQAATPSALDLDGLRDHLATRLPRMSVPEEILLTSAMPLGATGKIDKKRLLSLWEEARRLSVASAGLTDGPDELSEAASSYRQDEQ